MARNTGNDHRIGSVSGRTQLFNPATGTWLKRDMGNGRFMAGKADPYKGVAREEDGRRR